MENILDLNEIEEFLAEDIAELYEFDKQVSEEDAPYPESELADICANILITRSWDDTDILKENYNDLTNKILTEIEYDVDEAEEIFDRLCDFADSDEDDIIDALRDFDKFSRDFSDDDIYPMIMMNSLSVIQLIMSSTNSSRVCDAATYVISNYDNFWLSSIYQDNSKEIYDRVCKKLGFFSTKRRIEYRSGMTIAEIIEASRDPDIVRLENFLSNNGKDRNDR